MHFVGRYLVQLETTKLILWCYLAWYIAIVVRYFDPAPALWLSSLGIAGLIGYALNLAARQKDRASDRWVVFRLYLFPFCVSSYSALIKGRGFFLLFPGEVTSLVIGLAACLGVVLFARGGRWLILRRDRITAANGTGQLGLE